MLGLSPRHPWSTLLSPVLSGRLLSSTTFAVPTALTRASCDMIKDDMERLWKDVSILFLPSLIPISVTRTVFSFGYDSLLFQSPVSSFHVSPLRCSCSTAPPFLNLTLHDGSTV